MNAHFGVDLPKGIQKVTNLPDDSLSALWDSIVVEEDLKGRLFSQAVLNFSLRPTMSRTVLPLHGVILLEHFPLTLVHIPPRRSSFSPLRE